MMQISNNTYFGIEIEICVDPSFYDGALGHSGYESNYGTGEQEWTLPPATKDGSRSTSYDRIILSQDLSCKCLPGMVSAEIISPKCNRKNFPFYREFLLKKVLSNMDSLEQGMTCGIHIHWSNDRIIPKNYMIDDRFLFLLVYNIYRTTIICGDYLKSPDISGRHHQYSRVGDLNISYSDLDPDIIGITKERVNLMKRMKSVETIETALGRINRTSHNYYGIRFSTLIAIIIGKIGDRATISQELDIFYGLKGTLDRLTLNTTLNWFPMFDMRLGEAGPHAAEFLLAYDQILYMYEKSKSGEYNLEGLYNSTRADWWPKYDEVMDTCDIDIVGTMIKHNKKAMMNVIDISDMHLEFRIFSLDTLFEDRKPTGHQIISKLEEFIIFTEKYCTGIVRAVVKAFKETKGNPDLLVKNVGYLKTFKYGEYYTGSNDLMESILRPQD
jgi:hypothetical protein